MDKLLKIMESVASGVIGEFAARGGVLRDGDRPVAPDVASAVRGGLSPLLWMLSEFMADYDLDFPEIVYRTDPDSLTGFVADRVVSDGSSSPPIFALSDFLKNELFPASVHEFDMSSLLIGFREWGFDHVDNAPGRSPVESALLEQD